MGISAEKSILEGLEIAVYYLSNAGPAFITGTVTEVNHLRSTILIETGEFSKNVFFKKILGVEET